MTAVTRVVRRETSVVYRGRPLVVELHAGYMTMREKGRRLAVTVDYRAIYDLGFKMLERARRQERQQAKQAKTEQAKTRRARA